MKKVIAVATLLLMLGCSAPDTPSTAERPGDEATSETSPTPENTTPPDDGGDGNDDAGEDGGDGTDAEGEADQKVSVELPGLPIGGNEVLFSPDAPTQCVDVNTTGFTVPDGVGIVLIKIIVPDQFTTESSPCPDAPRCVEGSFRISAGGCTVSVTWKGDPVDAGKSYPLTADTMASCTSRAACADVKAAVDAAKKTQSSGQFSIRLIVAPAEGESSTAEGDSTPDNGESTPVDGESTPADGESTPAASPSDDSSDG